jgi:phosphomannomutase
MTLIKSISGIRGTIGGKAGDALTPMDIVKFTAAYGRWVIETTNNYKVVIGRDARISGEMVNHLVIGMLMGLGIDVIDLGLSTTPTVEIAVPTEQAGGGIIITASHNPAQWNALKLLNFKGEFIDDLEGQRVIEIAEDAGTRFATIDKLGKVTEGNTYLEEHIRKILALPLVDIEAIKRAQFKVVIDCVNSTGGIFIPPLLRALGVAHIDELYCTPNGVFPHNPEPLPENLTVIAARVAATGANLGIVVDPDVDRLCFVNQDGSMFGEEYTLVAVADYVLSRTPGNTVSNLSSTRALQDVTEKSGGTYHASAVGEVNVVAKMKQTNAVIGGEGNGGIIYPELHYGRDALVGIALFLTHLAQSSQNMLQLRNTYPPYFISKNKITLEEGTDIDGLLQKVEEKYKSHPYSTIDGLKIEIGKQWIHLRKSNTEPVIRIYVEAPSMVEADKLASQVMLDITSFTKT